MEDSVPVLLEAFQNSSHTFNPADFLRNDVPAHLASPKLIILNQPLTNFELFKRLWSHASIRVCADGAANRLFDMLSGDLHAQRSTFLPDVIHGDLDSLREDVDKYYSAHGVSITRNPDQESTDFGKVMQLLTTSISPSDHEAQDTIIISGIGGRVDQGLGLLHELLREYKTHPRIRLWLVSESSVSFILPPGLNSIHTSLPEETYFTPNVGIIPIFGPAVISTEGLEWDVKTWKTSMGTRVSTSNHVVQETVTVETDQVVLFTIEQGPLLA